MAMLRQKMLRFALGGVLARCSAWRLAQLRKAVDHDPNARAGVDAWRPVGSGLFGALVSNH